MSQRSLQLLALVVLGLGTPLRSLAADFTADQVRTMLAQADSRTPIDLRFTARIRLDPTRIGAVSTPR